MEIKIQSDISKFVHVCPQCLGSRTQKAMQMAQTFNGSTVRTDNTNVKCQTCNGKGYVPIRSQKV